MAGRIRSIKPEILEDEVAAHLSHLGYRLFTGTWLVADDYGNLRADPDYIRGQIIWAHRESRETIEAELRELVRVGLLVQYVVRGQTYFHIKNWDRHQRVDKPGKPRMPGPQISISAPPPNDPTEDLDSRESRESLAKSQEPLAPDLRPTTSDHDPTESTEPIAIVRQSARRGPQSRTPQDTPTVVPSLLPEGWKPSDTQRNRDTERRAAESGGVVVAYAFEKFVERMAAEGRTSRSWDAEWRLFLASEFPTPEQIREARKRGDRAVTPQAARDRERDHLAEIERRAEPEAAARVLADFLNPVKATG